jgi:hypothetical protein
MTAVALSSVTAATELDDPDGTAVVTGSTHSFTPTKRLDKVLVRLVDTSTASNAVVFLAGDANPAQSEGLGNLTITVAGSATSFVGGLESARFLQDDGSVSFTVAGNATVTVFQLP